MKIIVDTREQTALKFKHVTVSRKLDVGDYGCQFKDGHIPDIFFERKTIGDLYGTLGKGYKRFKKEITRAIDTDTTLLIIVDGTFTQVLNGYRYSRRAGISIITQLMTIWVRHGIRPIFCKDAKEMALFITEFYKGVGREYVKQKSSRNIRK